MKPIQWCGKTRRGIGLSEGKICSIVVLLFMSILIANTVVPIIAEEQESQVTSPDGVGPYKVSFMDIFNITKTGGKWLPISIYYPAIEQGEDSNPNKTDAPYPTLFLSPGLGASIGTYREFAERIASWGFVFVVVGSTMGTYDLARLQDLVETLNWLDEQNDNSSFKLGLMMDESRYGVLGHSAGGAAAILASGSESRFKVSVPIAAHIGSPPYVVTYESAADISIPVLITVGAKDDRRMDMAPEIYEVSKPPKFLIILEGDVGHGNIVTEFLCQKYVVSFLKVYLSGEEGYIGYLYGEHAQQEIDEGKIQLYYDVSEGAPVFELSSLFVDPSVVEVGEEVSASIEVANTGDKAGSYTIILKIDEAVEDEKLVTLGPDESVTVSFEVPATEEGTYSVDINGLSGSYDVEKAQTGIPGFPLESIVLSMVLAVLVLWYAQRQR
jgi:dienelactone hydrolase